MLNLESLISTTATLLALCRLYISSFVVVRSHRSATNASSKKAGKKILRMVDRIANSKYFQQATEMKYIKKAMEGVSNTRIMLSVELKGLVGTLAVNLPPPPSDRLWSVRFFLFFQSSFRKKRAIIFMFYLLCLSGMAFMEILSYGCQPIQLLVSVRSTFIIFQIGLSRNCVKNFRLVISFFFLVQ